MGQHAEVLLGSLHEINAVPLYTFAKLNIICLFV